MEKQQGLFVNNILGWVVTFFIELLRATGGLSWRLNTVAWLDFKWSWVEFYRSIAYVVCLLSKDGCIFIYNQNDKRHVIFECCWLSVNIGMQPKYIHMGQVCTQDEHDELIAELVLTCLLVLIDLSYLLICLF